MNWATAKLDTSGLTHFLVSDHGRLTFAEAASEFGRAPPRAIRRRIQRGWTLERSFTTPIEDEVRDWRTSTVRTKISVVQALVAKNISLESIADRFTNVDPSQIATFCGNHSIKYGGERRKKDEGAQGERHWDKSIDGNARPSNQGVRFIDTNNDTCRWPLWSDASGPASERLCCGRQTAGGAYCKDHASRGKMAG